MTEPQRLYTVSDVASFLGITKQWVHNELDCKTRVAPRPQFTATMIGKSPTLLWSHSGMVCWEVYYASLNSVPSSVTRHSAYSDHRAVNELARTGTVVTWKLWWRCSPDGPVWWLSTPTGWWVSDNDGREWRNAECMVRPADYHYFSVNGTTKPSPALAAVIRNATRLRQRLENNAEGSS